MTESYSSIKAECEDMERSGKGKMSLDEIIGRGYDNTAMEIYDCIINTDPSSVVKEEGVRYLNDIISNIDQDLLRLSIYLHSLGYPSENQSICKNNESISMKNRITELLQIKHHIISARNALMVDNVSLECDMYYDD